MLRLGTAGAAASRLTVPRTPPSFFSSRSFLRLWFLPCLRSFAFSRRVEAPALFYSSVLLWLLLFVTNVPWCFIVYTLADKVHSSGEAVSFFFPCILRGCRFSMTEANLDGRMAERLGSQPEQPWGTEAGSGHFWPPLKSLACGTEIEV